MCPSSPLRLLKCELRGSRKIGCIRRHEIYLHYFKMTSRALCVRVSVLGLFQIKQLARRPCYEIARHKIYQ